MKKSVIAVFLLLAVIGCVPTTEESQPTDFRFGTEGIYMSFVPNVPPPRLFEREAFNVMIQVENRGSSDLGGSGDRIFISGFDNTIIQGISSYGEVIPPLEGRSQFVSKGDIGIVNFGGTISLAGKRIPRYDAPVLATACYGYETVASAQVCMDPNPFAPTRVQKVCIASPVSTGSQGAPIAVSSVEVDPAPGRTRFEIYIQNVGAGDVFKHGTQYLDKCSPYNPGLSFDEIDYVQLADITLSGVSIKQSCKPVDPTSHIRLSNGQAVIFCEFSNFRTQNAYTTPLNIILRYNYRESIFTQVEIIPIT